jgi:tetratricopeptide (TPR) repeat protein
MRVYGFRTLSIEPRLSEGNQALGLLRKLFSSSRKSHSGFVRDKRGLGIAEALSPPLLSSANAPSRLVAEASSLNAEGRYGDSLALIGHALMVAPDDPELLFAKGSTLYEWGRFREARDVLLRAEGSAINITSLYLQLGWACLSLGNCAEGETWMRKAVLAEPDGWEAHFGLGAALQAAGRLDEAVASLEAGLERNPNHFETAVLLGGCKLNQENPGAAEAFFRRAIAVNGNRADVWVNLAVAVCRQGRIQEAGGAIARAEGLEATTGAELGDLAILGETFKDAGYLQAALALYERSLPQWPSMAGHFNYAHALLTSGRLAEGWNHYEFRWLGEPFLSLRPSYGRPTWSGQDLNGKTILLRAEQGFGDTIHFLRYAPRLKMMGATVVLHVIKGLADVARGCPGIDLVWEDGEMPPSVDFYIHLMSLARVFGTDIDSIPNAIPYLNVEPARVEQWAIRLGPDRRPKVGIVWAGSHVHLRDRYRSMSLHTLSVLGDLKEVRFISLQKGAAVEARGSAPVLPLLDLDSELKDFGDTEAVISQLDLVISVDTAVAHLAGALGKPVWVMVAEPADWRWLIDREDSPWYPTMRLFRQRRRGDWDEVVARVKVALQEWLRGDHTHHAASAGKFAPAVQEPTRPKVLSLGVASRVRPGFCAVAETRVGILEYRPDLDPVGKSIDWYGEYLQPELDLIEELIRPGATVLEVGAGIECMRFFWPRPLAMPDTSFCTSLDICSNGFYGQISAQIVRPT